MDTVQKTYKVFATLLEKKGVTPYRVYKETGVPQSSLSEWKRGNSMPKIDKIQKLAEYFGVTVDYLLTGEESTQKENALAITGKSEIEFDDFTYAMQNESKELTEEDKALLLSMARQLKIARDKRNGEPD